jgi:hypothetical protein
MVEVDAGFAHAETVAPDRRSASRQG